jgi:hypothetical protein
LDLGDADVNFYEFCDNHVDTIGAGRRVGGWQPFKKARAFARHLGLHSVSEWKKHWEQRADGVRGEALSATNFESE